MTEVTTARSEVAKAETVSVEAADTNAPANGVAELLTLRQQGERLKLERDNAQLRAELAQLARPWWRKGAVVTTLTAIVASVVPVTTAMQAHYQKERELAIEETKETHQIRTSYLDRIEKPGARLRTLRFVLATTSDPELKRWALQEQAQAQAELQAIDQQIAAVRAEYAQAGAAGGKEDDDSDPETDDSDTNIGPPSTSVPAKGMGSAAKATSASSDPALESISEIEEFKIRLKLSKIRHELEVLKLEEQRLSRMDLTAYNLVKSKRLAKEHEASLLEAEEALWKTKAGFLII